MDLLHNLNITPEEEQLLAWCYQNLDEVQAAEVELDAIEMATAEINAPEAAEKLLSTLVQVIVRSAREKRDEHHRK